MAGVLHQQKIQIFPSIMGKMVLCLLVSCLILVSANQDFKINVDREDDVDLLEITNKQGEVEELVEVHFDENYQIIKPKTGNECFFTIARSGQEETVCSRREEWIPEMPEDEEMAREKCGKRRIFALREVPCEGESAGRGKRACVLQTIPVSSCTREETFCIRYGWWTGKNTCKEYGKRCASYTTVNSVTLVC